MAKPKYQETVDSMTEDFRAYTIGRLECIDQILTEFQADKDNVPAEFKAIGEQVHCIAGTAKTFGFHALAHIVYRLNEWIHDIETNNRDGIDIHSPELRSDLATYLELMFITTREKENLTDQQGKEAMSEIKFLLYHESSIEMSE